REELHHVVIEKGQAGGADTEGKRGKVRLAAANRRFELRGTIAAVAETFERRMQVDEPVKVHSRVGSQILAEIEMASLAAELTATQQRKCIARAIEQVRTWRQGVDGVDNEIQIGCARIARKNLCRQIAAHV